MIIKTKYDLGQKVAYREGQDNEILKYGEILKIEVIKEKDFYKEIYMVSDLTEPNEHERCESRLDPDEIEAYNE
jgi:hypothetical protein